MQYLLHVGGLFNDDLVDGLDQEDLEIKSHDGDTTLTYAAAVGNVKIAKARVDKNRKLLSIKNENGFFPVVVAAYAMKI